MDLTQIHHMHIEILNKMFIKNAVENFGTNRKDGLKYFKY